MIDDEDADDGGVEAHERQDRLNGGEHAAERGAPARGRFQRPDTSHEWLQRGCDDRGIRVRTDGEIDLIEAVGSVEEPLSGREVDETDGATEQRGRARWIERAANRERDLAGWAVRREATSGSETGMGEEAR